MRSLLKAYRSMLANDSEARVPRLDDLVKSETDGSLPKVMEALVTANCKGKASPGRRRASPLTRLRDDCDG